LIDGHEHRCFAVHVARRSPERPRRAPGSRDGRPVIVREEGAPLLAGDGAASRPPAVLSIAGSDASGGAGIQADVRAFAACGVYGMTAVTAIVAGGTAGVRRVQPLPTDLVCDQVEAILDDLPVDAVKVGFVGSAENAEAILRLLDRLAGTPLVVDPVVVAASGARLLPPSGLTAVGTLVGRASVATPNLTEARALAGDEGLYAAGAAAGVLALGAAAVVVTGGHDSRGADLYLDHAGSRTLSGPRWPDGAAHGSGCTHSAALAARLAHGDTPAEAARIARRVAGHAVRRGLRSLGAGPAPVDPIGLPR